MSTWLGCVVEGQVVDVMAAPFDEATVSVVEMLPSEPDAWVRAPIHRTVITARTGRFVAMGLPSGTYRFAAMTPGHATAHFFGIEIAPFCKAIDLGVLTLGEGVAIEGWVIDRNDTAIENVSIIVRRYQAMGIEEAVRTFTDAQGRFRVGPLGAGRRYSLQVLADGYRMGSRTELVPPLAEPITIELERLGGLSGRVVDASGTPVVDFLLRIRGASGPSRSVHRPDSEGRFTVEDLDEGIYTVIAEADGLMPAAVEGVEVIAGEHTDDVEVVSTRPWAVSTRSDATFRRRDRAS
ncbi:MAG: carboxypeptidase-like regulatory domain-containing protein [Acidobacteriota bacterium]